MSLSIIHTKLNLKHFLKFGVLYISLKTHCNHSLLKVNQITKPAATAKIMASAGDVASWYEAVQLYEVNRIDEAIEKFKASKQNAKMLMNTGCCYLRKNNLKGAEQVRLNIWLFYKHLSNIFHLWYEKPHCSGMWMRRYLKQTARFLRLVYRKAKFCYYGQKVNPLTVTKFTVFRHVISRYSRYIMVHGSRRS